nr:MAG TPA: hypothetical protein [Caudoviricetes sp.]
MGGIPNCEVHSPTNVGEDIVYSPFKISGNRGYKGQPAVANLSKTCSIRFTKLSPKVNIVLNQ